MRFILLGLAFGAVLEAQVASGSIFGRVTDESGALVPATSVTLRQEASGFTRMAVTGDSGAYRMDQLAPGIYSITASHPGLRTLVESHVTVEVNQQLEVNLQLVIGEARESAVVAASVSPLDTSDSEIGYRVDSATMNQLPIDERNVVSLVTLGPGAIPRQLGGFTHDVNNDVQQGSRGSVAFNAPINGARSYMNGFLLDGAYNQDPNTFSIVIDPPMESVQEFRILSSLAPAALSQAGGGLVDIITKSGGRDFHGSAFEYFRNEATDARNFFDDPALPRSIFRRNQFGGSLGGRLPLPSTFFFVTYEGLRGKSATPSLQLVPDSGPRGGDFSGGNIIYDPLSATAAGGRMPFDGNRIPANRIDPIARKYLDQFEPLPNRTDSSSNYMDATPSTSDHDAVSGRMDHQLRRGGLLFGRYTVNDERGGIGGNFPLRPTDEELRAQQVVVGHTLAGASWSNDLRASFTRLRLFDTPIAAFKENVAAQLGILDPPADPFSFGLPYFFLTNYSTVTDDPTLPQIQRDNTWGFSETLSMVRGTRTYKVGANWAHFQMNYRQSNTIRGQYNYTGVFTGNGTDPNSGDPLADFLLGYPQGTQRQAGDSQAYLRRNSYSAFAEQDWQANSRFTLTLGVRYDYTSPFTEARNKLLNLDYSTLPQPPQLVSVQQATDPNLTDFAPRVGLAWRLPGDTMFRAGYGIYYSQEIAVESYDLVLNGTNTQLNQTDGTQLPILTTQNGFPSTPSTGFPSYFGVDRRLPTPYVQQWNAGFQRQLPGAILFEASYVGSKGTHLGRFRRFNTALHTETGENLAPRPGDLQSLRTFPSLGTIFQREHIANSTYHSLQLKAEKRYRRSLSFLASFVWSKSIDDASSEIPGFFDSVGAQDERNLSLDKGLSFFNVGRRFSGGFVYELPAIGRRLGGWELSGIVTLQDGTPLDVFYYATDTVNAGTFMRPDVVPGQSVSLPPDQRSADHWFNTNAFTAPAPYQFGNAGRDILPGPGNAVIDLALHKRFRLSEHKSLELRGEGFNVVNHPNFGIPGPYPDFGPFFGKIFSTGDPRRFQFATRLDF